MLGEIGREHVREPVTRQNHDTSKGPAFGKDEYIVNLQGHEQHY